MSLCNITYFSKSLGKQSQMLVIMPDNLDAAPHKVVYQLHGYSDNATNWLRYSSIERYANARSLMIVCPDGGKGFYTNAVLGDKYEDHIMEAVDFVDNTFNTIKDRSGRFIGGLSMGGYGALKLGLKHYDKFSSIASHSSVIDIDDFREILKMPDFTDSIFGKETGDDNNLYYLAKKYGEKVRIRFDCGKDDFLYTQNERFHEFLSNNNIQHVYKTYPGEHNWEYWDAHIAEALDFHIFTS